VKLLDFGIAKFALDDATGITRSGEVIGSPLYMAPEQARGEVEIDARVDVWSVGAMLFEMLTGKPAHLGPSAIAVLAKILTETAPSPSSRRPSVPREVDAVVQRALVIERDDRYESARAMLDGLVDARAKCGWSTAAPVFEAAPMRASMPAREPTPVSDRRDRAESREPAMESAVTAGTVTTPRSRLVGIVIAACTLVLGALLPWLVWGWGMGRGEAVATTAERPTAVKASAAPSTTPSATPSTSPSTPSTPSTSTNVEAGRDAGGDAAVTELDAGRAVVRAPRAAVSAADSKPACEAGEVVSLGHCCPRGHIWQSGRCERPLATSF
jgi:serine/threonine protein kinase